MSLEDIKQFGQRLDVMKNPRERRAFIDSFHARLIQGDIYTLNAASIRETAEIEKKHGFDSHAKKLLAHSHYEKTLEEAVPYFFLVNDDYVIGTPKGIRSSETTIDLPFHDLANNYDLQVKLHLASAALIKPVWNPPLAYPLGGQKLVEHAATYLAAFADTHLEQNERRHYLVSNGLVRILITNDSIRDEVRKIA